MLAATSAGRSASSATTVIPNRSSGAIAGPCTPAVASTRSGLSATIVSRFIAWADIPPTDARDFASGG